GHKGLATSGALCEAPPLHPAAYYMVEPPPMFEGKKIKAFLAHYELYADALDPTGQKRSLFIHRYIPKMVSAIIHHHLSTSSGDWASIKALLISIYHNEEEELSTQNETCEDIHEVTINDTTTTPPTSNDCTHLESVAKPITTPSVGIRHIHLESIDEPTAIPPAADLIATNAEVDACNTESSETQSSVPPELTHSDVCEHTHQDDTQMCLHEDIPPDDHPSVSTDHTHRKPVDEPTNHPPVGADHIHLESVGEPITIPPTADLTAAKAEVDEHDPGPPEPQPSALPKPLYSEHIQTNIRHEHILKEPDDHPMQHDSAHEVTTTYSPQHDSIAEHVNRILCHIVCMKQHMPRPPTRFWPKATTEATSYIQQHQPSNPLNGVTPYDQQLGQAPNISHLSHATYHQVTPHSQWFSKTPNILHPHTIGYATYQRTMPYSLWFGHTLSIACTRMFDRVDHRQATPNETDEETSPPDWTYYEPDNTDTATERQEPAISDMTAKCPASRTASDDRPNDEHTSDRHLNDDHPNDECPSNVQSTDNPTHEQIKGRPDEQQWHDATSAETYGIHKKNIATCNVGFNANKTCHDHKHTNANAEKPELITTDETAKCTISRATDNAHQTSDSTYEDAAE
ncbi:hypothetical protein EV182_004579, partial [Spiromyces aspiralis]